MVPRCPERTRSDRFTVQSKPLSGSDQMNSLPFPQPEMTESSSEPAKQQESLPISSSLLKSESISTTFPAATGCERVGRS